MSVLFKPVILTIALAGASSVFAASSVDLTVKGVITPAACAPSVSQGGVVDHGKISAQDLQPWNTTLLPDATLQLVVNCEAPTLVAVKSTDNRAGTSGMYDWEEVSSFGLGLASDGAKIGYYLMKMTNAAADDVPRSVIESVDGATWMDASGNTIWQPNWMRSVNDGSTATPSPLPLKTFKADLVISTGLRGYKQLPITEEIQIDGSATLDIVYL